MGVKAKDRKVLNSNIQPVDWARLAAYIDGEGCISVHGNMGQVKLGKSQNFAMKVAVVNTDPRLAKWIFDTFGVGNAVRKAKSPSIAEEVWRPIFTWYVMSKNASLILEGCLPFFVIKREQAEIAIAFQKTKVLHNRGRLGERVPDHVIEFRRELHQQLKDLKHRDFDSLAEVV